MCKLFVDEWALYDNAILIWRLLKLLYGIIIRMYCLPGEHNPLHIHAYYQEFKAIIDVNNCELSEGRLPSKQMKLALAWAEI
jgi:hypothetical protein